MQRERESESARYYTVCRLQFLDLNKLTSLPDQPGEREKRRRIDTERERERESMLNMNLFVDCSSWI